MVSIAFQTLNLTLNQMREKSTEMNIILKQSSKLLKSIDDDIKPIKAQYIYFTFFHFNFPKDFIAK